MSSTGTPSQYCSPTDMSHGDLGIIAKNDAIIIISNSGKSEEFRALLDFANIRDQQDVDEFNQKYNVSLNIAQEG